MRVLFEPISGLKIDLSPAGWRPRALGQKQAHFRCCWFDRRSSRAFVAAASSQLSRASPVCLLAHTLCSPNLQSSSSSPVSLANLICGSHLSAIRARLALDSKKSMDQQRARRNAACLRSRPDQGPSAAEFIVCVCVCVLVPTNRERRLDGIAATHRLSADFLSFQFRIRLCLSPVGCLPQPEPDMTAAAKVVQPCNNRATQ